MASVAFSPDRHTLATGEYDGALRLWDVTDPAHPRPRGQPLTGAGADASVAFSPMGHTLATVGADGAIRLWDVTNPAHPRPARPAPGRQPRAWLGGVQPWRAHAGQRRRRWRGRAVGCHRSRAPPPARPAPDLQHRRAIVASVAFSPAGTRWPPAATTAPSSCGTSPIRAPRPLGRPGPAAGRHASVAFSRDGHSWPAANTAPSGCGMSPIPCGRPLGPPLTGSAVKFGGVQPRRAHAGHASYDGTVQLWDVTDPVQPRPLGPPLTVSTAPSIGWRSVPMGTRWPQVALTARPGSGT